MVELESRKNRVKRLELPFENRSKKYWVSVLDTMDIWFRRQYNLIYKARVAAARERILENARRMLGENIVVSSLEGVAEEDEDGDSQDSGHDVFVIGTIEKRIQARPSVLKQMANDDMKIVEDSDETEETSSVSFSRLVGEDDYLEFEDDNQIVKIAGKIDMNDVATGLTCGLYGRQTREGFFEVRQVVLPALAPQRPLPEFNGDPMIAFLSGIAIKGDPLVDTASLCALSLFTQWVGGQMGIETDDVARVMRVVIAGESISVGNELEKFTEQAVYLSRSEEAPNVNCSRQLDEYLARLTSLIPVDLMPGEGDPAIHFQPQNPIHKCLFPMAGFNGGMLHLATNPYEFSVGGADVMVLSGQTVTDLRRLSCHTSACSLMELMMNWQHIAPTCPDTVDCFPLADRDPFFIETLPHVMVAGNQPAPEVRKLSYPGGRRVTLVSLPSFARSQLVALVNLRTMDVTWKQFSI